MTNGPTSTERKCLLIAGGGTGGHIYPAIAVAKEFLAAGAGREVVFVGTPYGLENQIVPKAGFPLELVDVRGLKGKSLLTTLRNLVRLPASLFTAWRIISRTRPDAILGVGGYASGPVLLVGALRRYPTMIQEQNAYPGITNRILARFVREVAVAFPEALAHLRREGSVTGNPVRPEFFEQPAPPPSSPDRPRRLLVFGGSQGSRILNETMIESLDRLAPLKPRLSIVHQTGPSGLDAVQQAYRRSAFADARVVAFLDPMADEMAAADVVLCRAGAITIGELAAIGRASILIPFAAAADNHQEFNARAMEKAGGAVVITERELNPERLATAISELIAAPERTRRMASGAKTVATPDAARTIVEILTRIAGN